MRRLFPQALFVVIFAILMAGNLSATTYYVADNGSDVNNGTSRTSPWLHAPGMPNCSATCASATPQPGDRFIFRGGDSWHFGNSSPSSGAYIGNGSWSWSSSWAGSSGGCQMDPSNGTVVLTSCIYIGVDQTWYTGSSWTRPQFNFDNPLNTGFVSNCSYNDDSLNGWFIRAGYVQVDNLEFLGYCTDSSGNSGMFDVLASPVDFSYDYWHGWTETGGAASNGAAAVNCNGSGCFGFIKFDHVIVDGSDSSGASSSYTATMTGLKVCTDVEYSVLRYLANNCVDDSGQSGGSGAHIFHDNLFEYFYNPTGGGHGNVIEMHSGVYPGYSYGPVYFYNNVARHMDEGITFDLIPNAGGSVYIFNNVLYDIANGVNCLGPNSNGGSTGITAYIYNNTFDYQPNVQGNSNGGCKIGGGTNATLNLQNNHFINYNSANCSGSCSGYISAIASGTTVNDLGNEVWQTESTANGQGYTSSNAYQPTSTSGSTYHNGANSSSHCSAFSPDASLCNGTSEGVTMGAGAIADLVINPQPQRGTTWDAGAYQFGSGSSNQPNPPTGLAALVQ